LFHWFRTQPKTLPSRASKRRLRHAL
jgi:hypothetical protein